MGSAYTPVGWVQRILEFIHVNFNLPWWASISICEKYLYFSTICIQYLQFGTNVILSCILFCKIIGVVIVRLLMFPLVVKNQRNSIQMHNIMPQMQEIQMKMQNAKTYGNHMEGIFLNFFFVFKTNYNYIY